MKFCNFLSSLRKPACIWCGASPTCYFFWSCGTSLSTGSEVSTKHYQPPARYMHVDHQHYPVPRTDGRASQSTSGHPFVRIQGAFDCRLQDLTPAPTMTIPMTHSSRPTLGFPLGTALLLIVIFSLSGIFSCCYHWDRLRSLWSRHPAMLQEGQHTVVSMGAAPSKAASDRKNEKSGKECGLPVIMPGDNIPKFFARPCPHETCLPAAAEKDEVEVQVKCSVSWDLFESLNEAVVSR